MGFSAASSGCPTAEATNYSLDKDIKDGFC